MSAAAGSSRQAAKAAPAAEAAAPTAPQPSAQLNRDGTVEAAIIAACAKEAAARSQAAAARWQGVLLVVGLALLGVFVRDGLAHSGASVRDGLSNFTKGMSGEFKVYHGIANPLCHKKRRQ